MPSMNSVTALPRTSHTKWRSAKPFSSSSSAPSPLPNVTDVSRQAAMGHNVTRFNVEEPPLREYNAALRVLIDVFPSVRPEVFREMLSSISDESRLQIVTENLLSNQSKWVRGRLRVTHEADETAEAKETRTDFQHSPHHVRLAPEDRFRSLSYKTAVSDSLSQEFKGLSKSAIRAVLAECNHSYMLARPILLELVSKSWRFSFSRFVFRRKLPTASDHPLVSWEPCKVGASSLMQPTLRFTPSTELNLELWSALVQPVIDKQKADQVKQDFELSKRLNEDQAQELGELYDCGCCFTSYAMEHLSTCTDQCHYICYACIRHTINEALFGQGWAKGIDHERCTINCIAPNESDAPCLGFVPAVMVQLALEEDAESSDAWAKLQDRCSSEVLLKCGLGLISCPFCTYAEVDDFNTSKVHWKFPFLPTLGVIVAALQILFLLCFPLVRYSVLVNMIPILFNSLRTRTAPLLPTLHASILRLTRKRRGLKLTCASPRCGRSSCINCRKPWVDIHVCFESARLALRAAIEAATTDAVKRTCPVCGLSFVKDAGCNKLTCVCGYTMCYVCRQEIGREKYGHFCQHFRQRPGEPCAECDRCDLYRVEDEDGLVREAAARAEKEWWERERRGEQVDADQIGRSGERKALEVERWQMESRGRLDVWLRALGNRARWEAWLDRVLGEFVA